MKVFSPFLNGTTTTSGSFNVPNHPSTASIQNPLTGSLFHDDTDGILKIYTGTQWQVVGEQSAPAGGGVSYSTDIEYLLVAGAGGGGGGGWGGGGGGAGGMLSSSLSSVTSGSSFTVTVGAGGAGQSGGNSFTSGGDGVDSSIAGATISTITSTGGGGGGAESANSGLGRDGGSGGGSTTANVSGGSGTAGQGNDGGAGDAATSPGYPGGGGGGKGSVGSDVSGNYGGNGGTGQESSITGTSLFYAGGGGGGTRSAGLQGTGGSSIGGGGANASTAATSATANRGSGGGGAGNAAGSNGSSGVAIFAYATGSFSGLGGIKTTRSDGYMVHTFNSSGTLTIAGSGEFPVANGSVFAPVTYTGNGGTQSISSLNFQPDLVWIKQRNGTASHSLQDIVRGAGQNYNLYSDNTAYEGQYGIYGYLSSFDTNGFTVEVGSGNHTNGNGNTYVAWCWKAGGAAVSNTDGSDTTSVSANQDAGFSIVSLSKTDTNTRTYGHGLSSAPEMIILKRTASADDWYVYHKDLGNTTRISLNSNAAKVTGTGVWGSTTPTDSVFTLQNQSGGAHIAYCFHSVDGYQKVGSYSSTGATGVGNQITTGFRPRFLLVKSYSNSEDWYIFDSERINLSGSNDGLLFANTSAIENTGFTRLEFTDTGWYWETAFGGNSSGYDYIYLAIA